MDWCSVFRTASLFAGLLTMCGCALLHPSAPDAVDVVAPEPAIALALEPDTLPIAEPPVFYNPIDGLPVPGASERAGKVAASREAKPVDSSPPSSGEPAPTDSTVATDPAEIRLMVTDEDREALAEKIESNLSSARTVADRLRARQPRDELVRQKLDTLEQYIRLATASVDAGDLRAAAGLALKARLLADDLGSR